MAKNQTWCYLGPDLFSREDGTWLYILRRIYKKRVSKYFSLGSWVFNFFQSQFHEQRFYVQGGTRPACWHLLFILLHSLQWKRPKVELFARFCSLVLIHSDSSSEIPICRNTDSRLETSTGNCLEHVCSNTFSVFPGHLGSCQNADSDSVALDWDSAFLPSSQMFPTLLACGSHFEI